MVRLFSALLALTLLATPASADRLSQTVLPEHYTLWFGPDLEKATFRGRETIRLQMKQPATAVTLHAAEITFGEVTITAGGRTQSARVTTDEKAETATFTVAQPIPAGAASIQIVYTGILNDKLRGFYISSANGRKYAVTQFEATDARRALPSFDEPMFKATFDISVTIDDGDTAISNSPPLSDTPGPEEGKHTLAFATTARMSTYLVAMLVGDWACREGLSDGTPIRVCSTPDKLALTGFALEAAEQQLAFFNHYFGIKYPFGKLDIVAVPDFAAGAMENAGAITFRERLLLVDPQHSSVDVLKVVAGVLSHEIAHQWFGDLVTMKWWDDVWLNEGFATWITALPIAAWRPQWRVDLQETEETRGALGLDTLRSTRPIRLKVDTPEEINEIFDGIAYEKAAAVLRMVEAYVGREEFRKGVVSYLKKFSYGNAAAEDFWNEVTQVTGKPVDRIMRTFVDQAGAPALTVRTECGRGNAGKVTLSQARFVGAPGPAPAASQVWTLPACLRTSEGPPRCEVIESREQTLRLGECGKVFANADSRGYYFSEYAPAAVHALGLDRSPPSLKPVERLGLLGDEWWMVRAGRHEVGVYLNLVATMGDDETPEVADTIGARLDYSGTYIADPPEQPRFQAWVRQRFMPALSALGLPGDTRDPDERQSRRATLLLLVGVTGNDPAVQRRAQELAARYIEDPTSLPPTLAPTVLQVAAVSGDSALYDQYVAQLETLAARPEDYYRFFDALPWFRDGALVKRTLDYSLTPGVRTQDAGILIAGVLGRPWGRDAAWEFTKRQWPTLTKRLGTFQGIPAIINALGSFCSTAAAADVTRFYATNAVPTAGRTIQQAVEKIEACAALDARQSKPFTAWLTAR